MQPAHASLRLRDRTGHGPEPARRHQEPVAIIRIPRLWPGAARAAAASTGPAVILTDPLTDGLEAFGSEAAPQDPTVVPDPAPHASSGMPARDVPRDWSGLIAALKWVGVILFSASTAAVAVWEYQRRTAVSPTGSVTIQTTPPGREVLVDGRSLGLTPVTVALAPASYAFQVGSGAERRDLAVDVRAGSSVLQHLELPSAPATPVATTGALHVQTEPSGQTISVDGVELGRSPITVSDLSAGDHTVVARGTAGTVRRTVAVKAGDGSFSGVFADGASDASSRMAECSVRDSSGAASERKADRHDGDRAADASGRHARHRVRQRSGWLSIIASGRDRAGKNDDRAGGAAVWSDQHQCAAVGGSVDCRRAHR